MKKQFCLFALCLLLLSGSAISQAKSHAKHKAGRSAKKKKVPKIQYGIASFYHNKFNGRRTANGEIFSQKKLTAAHNNAPFGTWLRVTNLRNKKTVVVRVTDRLHYRSHRLVDLSKAAANKIGFSSKGLLRVKVEVLGKIKQPA